VSVVGRPVRPRLRVAMLVATVLGAAGCAGDEPAADPVAPTSSSSSSFSSSSVPAKSGSASPAAESPFGEGPVADGLEARNLRSVESVTIPRGWISDDIDSETSVGAFSPDYGFTEMVVFSAGREEVRSTRSAARRYLKVLGPSFTEVEHLDPVSVDGEELFHLRAKQMSLDVEVFGQAQGGYLTFFAFYFDSEILPNGFQDETVAQVMRSVTFRAQG